MHAHITDTPTGFTLSLDSLLNTTSQTKLSECSPIPAKETDAHTGSQAPISDQSPQKTTASEHVQIKSPAACDQPIPLPDSSHQEQVKDDSVHTSDHSEANSDRSLTDISPQIHDANVQAKSLSDMHNQTLMHTDSSYQEHSTKDHAVIKTTQTASIDMPTVSNTTANEPHQIMLRYNDKLITALSLDPQGISRILLAKGLIPEHTEAQMQQSSTSCEKATILVTTVRQVVKISPKQFHAFLDILSKQAWMKDIMEELKSCHIYEGLRKDAGIQAASTSDQRSRDRECKSSGEISSNGEDHIFPKLDLEDKAELEAQLILSADSMRKKFASLLVNVINSFKHQGIDPRELASAVLALTEYEDSAIGKPLLDREKGSLKKA